MTRRPTGLRAAFPVFALGALLLLPALLATIPAPARAQDREEMSLGEQRIRKLTIPSLEWRVPAVGREVVRKALSNGAVLYVYPDHRFPWWTCWSSSGPGASTSRWRRRAWPT